jgi:hypothetical protein
MGAIEEIRARALRHPELVVDESPGWISVRPPGDDSFEVGLFAKDQRYTVYYEGWHEDAENQDEALEMFAMGLSRSVRLRVTARGRVDHLWTVQYRTEDGWSDGSTTGLLFFPFWKPKTVRYLQNDVIEMTDEP